MAGNDLLPVRFRYRHCFVSVTCDPWVTSNVLLWTSETFEFETPGLQSTFTCRTMRSYRIQWELLVDKNVRKACADSISSFLPVLAEFTADVRDELRLFEPVVISSAARLWEQKRLGVATDGKKITPSWNHQVKGYLSKEICLQSLASEQRWIFFAFTVQWKLLNRTSVYRANRLFKQFRLKKTILSFSSYKFFAY